MASRDFIKRLEALEEAVVGKHVELVFVPTRDLAIRVERAIAKRNPGRRISVVCYPTSDPNGEIEAGITRARPTRGGAVRQAIGGPGSGRVRKWQRTDQIQWP